ncbi:MAG: tetratricopeptide repeat protein [Candidatus Hydrogenedentes bacterium]|nr:tetratricopeptide repeat protein [Candidatus Hydrogenedentota bacterium]
MGEIAVRARALNTLGWIHSDLQDHAQSIEYNHRGVEVALLEGEEPEKLCNARLNWADAFLALGRFDEAETIFTEMKNTIRNPKPQDRWMLWRYSQHFFHSSGELCLAREDYDGAFSFANECLELAEHSSSLKYVVKARRLRAQAQCALGDIGGATQDLETAIHLAKDLGNPPQLWKSYAAMGELMNAQNKNTEATQAFRHAGTVLDTVAHGLPDEALRKTFLASDEVRFIRKA